MIEAFTKKYTYHILIGVGFLFFFHHLSQLGFHMDGLIYAAMGRNALLKDAWLVPSMSETMFNTFHDHVPFMIILQGLFFKVFGISFFTARLMVNLFSFATFLSIIYFMRKKANNFQVVLATFFFILSIPMLRHSRHPNFDMPLMLTCFLSINFYIQAIELNSKRDWFLSGIFFGLAMLFKGPMAVFVPVTIFVHLIVTKKLGILLRPVPWLALFSGFAIFSLWPLSLLSIDKFAIFKDWFNFTIINSIMGSRGAVKNEYFTYVFYLSTFTPAQIICMLVSFYKLRRSKISEFYLVHLIFFLVVLGMTSMMKFKLSHYLTALYPSLAIIASLGFNNGAKFKLQQIITLTMLSAGLIVFFLPQKPEKIRDYEIFEIRRVLNEKKLKAESYTVETGAYPFWSLVSLMSFLDGTRVDEVNSANLKIDKTSALYIILKADHVPFANKCTFIYHLKRYSSDAYFCP